MRNNAIIYQKKRDAEIAKKKKKKIEGEQKLERY